MWRRSSTRVVRSPRAPRSHWACRAWRCRRVCTMLNNPLPGAITMGLLDFVKSAGEKLFGTGQAKAAMQEAEAAPADAAKAKAANDAAADAIMGYIGSQGLKATGLTV